MNTLLWAGLVANALAHLRIAVLQVQDGEDRVNAGQFTPKQVICWQKGGVGVPYLILRTWMSPLITVFKLGKFLLFPRGIKSKFAKEQEKKAAAEAQETRQAEMNARIEECEALLRAWAPGEILLAAPEPQQLALGWHHAADVFDAASDLVARTKGQPWTPAGRVRAKVGK